MNSEFCIMISQAGVPYLERARELLLISETTRSLRLPETQAIYLEHQRKGGAGITPGLQENMFPYDVILQELHLCSQMHWGHWVFASLSPVDMSDLEQVSQQVLKASEYVVFINDPLQQSQNHYSHGHILAPTGVSAL